MPRALHHHHAHHPARHPHSNANSWLHILPRDGADWTAVVLLLFGIGLITYAVFADTPRDDSLPAFSSRPSTYD
jgi:hypothetical protein